MKVIILTFTLWIIVIGNIKSQSALRLYSGVNITNANYHLIDRLTNVDSSRLREKNYILPLLGVDLDFSLNSKFSLISGLGVSWMGSRNYQAIPDESIRTDSNLRLGYLRVPLILNYQVCDNVKFIGGYIFNYNFRKNQLLNTFDENNLLIHTYKPFHHGAVVGLRFDKYSWSLAINYHKGLSKIWDTKSFHRDYRAYLTLGGIQVTIGYLIKE